MVYQVYEFHILVSVEKIIGVIEKQSIIDLYLVRYKLCMRNRYIPNKVDTYHKYKALCRNK